MMYLRFLQVSELFLQDAHDLVNAESNELQLAYHFQRMDVDYIPDQYELSEF